MFSAKTSAPALGGLAAPTPSLFGNTSTQNLSPNTQPNANTPASGSLFGSLGTNINQNKPGGSLFGNLGGSTAQAGQQSGQSLFTSLGSSTAPAVSTTGSSHFGNTATTMSQPQTGSLFSAPNPNTNTSTQQSGTTSGLFGSLGNASNNQAQSKSLFGSLGTPNFTNTSPLSGGNQNTQQQQKPTLSLFGNQPSGSQQQQAQPPSQQPAPAPTTVVSGVKVDVSNLLPTTKFESCSDELKREIEAIDNFILSQIHMCNELSGVLPALSSQGLTIPNDVEFVQGKLETIQHALESDARDIELVRGLVSRDATEAQVAFRAIDNLKLPMQYQSSGGNWWSAPDQQLAEPQSLRSTVRNRKSTLALPDDVEQDSSLATSVNGVPINLVQYFSQRSSEMRNVLEGYTQNLKQIEDHVHVVEANLMRQVNEYLASRNRDGSSNGQLAKSQLDDLAAALTDVEAGIFGVANRLGGVKEEVQDLILGPSTLGLRRLG